MKVCVWFNDGWEDTSYERALEEIDLLDEVNPYWYNLGTEIGPPGANDTDGSIHARWNVNADRVQQLRSEGVLVIPTIGDRYIPGENGQVAEILSSPLSKARLYESIDEILKLYDGLDFNFEHIPSAQSVVFCDFVNDMSLKFYEAGKTLHVTLQAADSTEYEALLGYDLGLLKDIEHVTYKVMLYDNNYDAPDLNVPTPIAPIQWCDDVIRYFIERGIAPKKLRAAYHNYGYVWKRDGTASTLEGGFKSYNQILDQHVKQVRRIWDEVAQETFYTFTRDFIVYNAYIGDARSFAQRVKLAAEHGLDGVAVFVIGNESYEFYAPLHMLQEPRSNAPVEWPDSVNVIVSGNLTLTMRQ